MNLIIVESPTKAKTISKFLGSTYKVESSFGHVRDLPKSILGVDVEKDFQPKYVIPARSKKTVSELKSLVSKSEKIILATDEDREGEAIAWHLAQALGLDKSKKVMERIVFHEITKGAIENALSHPREIDMNLVDAQQARRVLDRIVGYKLSPFLWKKIARKLSAGRVQSVAVRLIVEREEDIRKFKSEEYYTIAAELETRNQKLEIRNFIANLYKIGDKALDKLDIKTKKDADEIIADLEKSSYQVADIIQKETRRNPMPPFMTSTLQQAAANKLRFSAKKTMFIAQRLYENGFITYMRTDSTNLSSDATSAAKRWLKDNLGDDYASEAPRQFKTKAKSAQEAHEAIRPTDIFNNPEKIKLENAEQQKLYKLIWQRFTASQMPQAKISTMTVEILAKEYLLRATGQRIIFDGFLKIWPQKFEESELPILTKGEPLDLISVKADQHFTEPPPRYSEATLVKALEEHGIGRPSTYAPIISVIEDRGYVNKEQGRFTPTQMGELVNQMLVNNFPKIVDIDFTAKMEEDLDKVAAGKQKWQKIVKEFYNPFIENLEAKYQEVERVKKPEPEKTDKVCDRCGKPMVIRQGRYGRFLACSGFPECKNTQKLESENSDNKSKTTGLKCPKCSEGEIVQRFARKRRRPFWGCSKYPNCDYATWEKPASS